ncbi:MAG TPA: type II 3-dehydroquinate dehydratase [Acidimicrobiales bacterium]|jgi:3-dehydroquinate dehydratase-2|nr:type II 3-dehydroquinate dehydratase [Acidimicrobiales bacterium]
MADPLIVLLSGPNLTLLGERQPLIYGTATLAEHVAIAAATAERLGYGFEHFQSDSEASLVAAVHATRDRAAGLVVNAAALTHYGWSLHDSLATFDGPIVELHISNPYAREPWRHTSILTGVCDGSIAGFGAVGYRLAVEAAHALIAKS